MKYLNVFDDKSVLNSSVASINHGNGAFVFGVKTKQGIEYVTIYDQRHPGGNCVRLGSVNMEPVRLDPSSTKENLEVGDFLYSTADGRLTLDEQTDGATNIPIANFVTYAYENFENGDDYENGFMTARFVSLNYMNYTTPTTGNKVPQAMYFGNNGTTIGNVAGNVAGGNDQVPMALETPYIGGIEDTLNIGGKWNTQQCLSKATNQDQNICDGVTNNAGIGYCAPACCCVAYSTPGTKPGDWYLPMPSELYQIYANKKAIDEKRKAIKYSGFSESKGYWSSRENSQPQSEPQPSSLEYASKSREDSSIGEYSVDLSDGSIHSYNKGNSNYVLAFLAVAPPEQFEQPGQPGQPGRLGRHEEG